MGWGWGWGRAPWGSGTERDTVPVLHRCITHGTETGQQHCGAAVGAPPAAPPGIPAHRNTTTHPRGMHRMKSKRLRSRTPASVRGGSRGRG